MFIKLTALICLITGFALASNHIENNPECDAEEEAVEKCAQKMVLLDRQPMPQTPEEMQTFCDNYKSEESCLRNHSLKCLSPSAHQTVTILINSVVQQNQKICSKGWRNKKRMINGGKCINKYHNKPIACLRNFIDNIQGIHQLTQNDKIPVICCNYHSYRKCATDDLSSDDRLCNSYTVRTIHNMIAGYSGDVLNYVCESYESYGQTCDPISQLISRYNNHENNSTKEETPKTFFSLMVKIYLS
ncbi:unnamed protein product [Medioppia subpectinata]|uniref:Uncharacterized protein n=1 Tax=Medioppia subpectinata TaxID=1979941 RepID=A0A7R9KPF5_9ACAR|nr:unnamed protein product [Medioppia subpectinata]CAG2105973.1 unnamed protein product [Medioppia subpectinata]